MASSVSCAEMSQSGSSSFTDKPKDTESLWTLFLLKLTCTRSKSRTCEISSHYGGLDIDVVDFQQLLDGLKDAKNNLVQHDGYLPRQRVLGSSPCVPGHVIEDNSHLPLLELECGFRTQAQLRHECRMAAIGVEANTKVRKCLIGKSRPMRDDYVPGRPVYHWSPPAARTQDGTRKSHGVTWRNSDRMCEGTKFGRHHLLRRKCEK